MAARTCFGFFVGDDTCQRCSAAKKCKAVLVSHGFDVAAGALEEVISTLSADAEFEIDLEELLADAEPGAGDAEKKRSHAEAKRVYGQVIHGGVLAAAEAASKKTTVKTDVIDPKDL